MLTKLSDRELYCPSHFGNTYECVLDHEMQSLLTEARFWGFNRFSDWFDTIDLYNVYAKKHTLFNLPEAIWQRRFNNYQIADKLGFETGLLITPNHVFSDQVTTANTATKESHIFGQLVCPSKPGVMEMIMDNYRNIFQDFVDRGIRLHFLSACPYDYGGCGCDKCSPWITIFGTLFSQIAAVAKDMFGAIEVELQGWWWKDIDHEVFAQWADVNMPSYFKSFAYHLPYGNHAYALRPIPKNCSEKAFVHIAYGETKSTDAYCHYGANIAPNRLEKTVRFLLERHAKGFLAYSEGDHDDVNKAILAGLSSGQFASADQVLAEYAQRYFGSKSSGWIELFHAVGDYPTINPKKTKELFKRLEFDAKPSWRLEQVEKRIQLADADHKAGAALEANRERDFMEAASAFLQVKESLYRQTWRLGLQRHAFRFDCPAYLPGWYGEYLKRQKKDVKEIKQDIIDQT